MIEYCIATASFPPTINLLLLSFDADPSLFDQFQSEPASTTNHKKPEKLGNSATLTRKNAA